MRLKLSVVLIAVLLCLPFAIASILNQPYPLKSAYSRVDNAPVSAAKNITMSKPYTLEDRPENLLPTQGFTEQTKNYGRATSDPYYQTYSYSYYRQGVRIIPRTDADLGRTPEEEPPLTGGYWGEAPKALQRVYDRRDYADTYEPKSGYDLMEYYQRSITSSKDNENIIMNETLIRGRDNWQRKLGGDPRVKSLDLPPYVDLTQVPWYVPPANPKDRPLQFVRARPQRQDQQGAFRFLPGVWQPRGYYTYGENHTYFNITERAQMLLDDPAIDAQRIIGRDIYSKAQRTLNDQFGEKYGYTIRSPSLAYLYALDVPEKGIGSVHNEQLFKFIRDQGKLPSQTEHYSVDPRFSEEAQPPQRILADEYTYYFYGENSPSAQVVLTTPGASGQRILDENNLDANYRRQYYEQYYADGQNTQTMPPYKYANNTFFPGYVPAYHSDYYRAKLAFIDERYGFIHRAASGTPKLYEPPADAYRYSSNYQPTNAQRMLKYETESPLPAAQRIVGNTPDTAQRRLNNATTG